MPNLGEYEQYVERQKETWGLGGRSAIERALAHYQETVTTVQQATEQLHAIDELIELINDGGLPEGYKVLTKTESSAPISVLPTERQWEARHSKKYPEHGTLIYRPNAEGEWELDGELITSGSGKEFLGDRILKLPDNQLVVINSEDQVGISPSDRVEIVDTLNDDLKNTLGGRRLARHAEALRCINQTREGAQVFLDCSWL